MHKIMMSLFASMRRDVFEPLHCKITKSCKLSYWRELEISQYRSEEELMLKQWQRLRAHLRFVYDNNQYYKKKFDAAGILPIDIKSISDIRRLPILTKNDIREYTNEMISNGYHTDKLMKCKTGGSTGKALEVYLTEECSHLRNACARRHDRWTGWEAGEPVGAVWGNPVLPKGMKQRLKHWLQMPWIYLDTMNVNDQAILKFAEQWERVKPTLLFGHAHSIFILAEYAKRLGIDSFKPKGIISTSMMLMPHERKCIEEVFGIKVTDRYGCEEVSLIASECERHEGMHLNIEHLVVEFIKEDGKPANPGEIGRIVVTDLMNKAMPFIRYQVEDMGVPSSRRCSCGRGLPLMDQVIGRTADFLIRRDRSRVAGVSLIENTLTKIPGIDQMQIVQESLDRIVIKIVAGKLFTYETQKTLVKYFQEQFGSDVTIEISMVNAIEPEKAGKYRFSICKVELS
jgi:phenylacetate-CoA ligase